ncbi:hypothetical protein PCANC_23998 [Puccinia coronata f. sp. avenae]|uniref:Uncharacterized protein n=1 Tax=Puccinia coronata f. sp. avenae TaxID=200324 RepID=A0A2N5TS81_9BASI|nr:hypothetical protein PCANC_23998 [Puccinia coronata f. sp. avenae]
MKGCTLMTGSLLVIEVQTLMTNIELVIQETPNGRLNTSPQACFLMTGIKLVIRTTKMTNVKPVIKSQNLMTGLIPVIKVGYYDGWY